MGCARFHDFISGATITLLTPEVDQSAAQDRVDILRSNARAQVLMAQHLKMLQGLHEPGQDTPSVHWRAPQTAGFPDPADSPATAWRSTAA